MVDKLTCKAVIRLGLRWSSDAGLADLQAAGFSPPATVLRLLVVADHRNQELRGFGGALRWLYCGFEVPIPWLSTRFVGALMSH